MFLPSWLKRLQKIFKTGPRVPLRRQSYRPLVEQMESRQVPSISSLTAQTITPVQGQTFTGSVATFSSSDAANAFAAQINWGDGHTTDGTVAASTTTTGQFTVTGSHRYHATGSFTVTVTLRESATGTGTATVADDSSQDTEGKSDSGDHEGDHERSGRAEHSEGHHGWDRAEHDGEDHESSKRAEHDDEHHGSERADHDEEDDDDEAATKPDPNGDKAVTVTVSAVAATEEVQFSGTVATFKDTDTTKTATDFKATINWGDGHKSAGTITGSNGSFTVAGTHQYKDEGSFPITVKVTETATTSSMVSVGSASQAPTFTSTPVTTAKVGTAYTYNITTADVNTGTRTITAPTKPAWLTLTDKGDGTATLTGMPSSTDVGMADVVLKVSDSTGASNTQSFKITVSTA